MPSLSQILQVGEAAHLFRLLEFISSSSRFIDTHFLSLEESRPKLAQTTYSANGRSNEVLSATRVDSNIVCSCP